MMQRGAAVEGERRRRACARSGSAPARARGSSAWLSSSVDRVGPRSRRARSRRGSSAAPRCGPPCHAPPLGDRQVGHDLAVLVAHPGGSGSDSSSISPSIHVLHRPSPRSDGHTRPRCVNPADRPEGSHERHGRLADPADAGNGRPRGRPPPSPGPGPRCLESAMRSSRRPTAQRRRTAAPGRLPAAMTSSSDASRRGHGQRRSIGGPQAVEQQRRGSGATRPARGPTPGRAWRRSPTASSASASARIDPRLTGPGEQRVHRDDDLRPDPHLVVRAALAGQRLVEAAVGRPGGRPSSRRRRRAPATGRRSPGRRRRR